MTVGPTLVPLPHESTVKGLVMPKIAMEGILCCGCWDTTFFLGWGGVKFNTDFTYVLQ